MEIRYYLDPETGEPHIFEHGVREEDAEYVLRHPGEDLPAKDGARQAFGPNRHRSIFTCDLCPGLGTAARVRDYGLRTSRQAARGISTPTAPQETEMTMQDYPAGWDEERAERLAHRYEELSQEEQTAEDEAAAQEQAGQTVIVVPEELLPAIRQLLAHHQGT